MSEGLRKRSRFKIYQFNAITKQIELVETANTKALTEKDFKRCLRREIAKFQNACWEICSGWIFYPKADDADFSLDDRKESENSDKNCKGEK